MAKYDVVKDYDWTSAPRGSEIRTHAPRVWVKSYKLNSNQISQTIGNYLNILDVTQDAKSFYDKMYSKSTTPDDDFNFPFFGDNIRSFSNTFGDTFQNGIGSGGGLMSNLFEGVKTFLGGVGEAAGLAGIDNLVKSAKTFAAGDRETAMDIFKAGIAKGGDPGTYIETPMFYQFEKNDGPLDVSFVLANTINEDSIDKNHKLVQRLIYINRPLRKNSIAVDPPRIYQVRVPGHRLIRWAWCSNFGLELLGTRRVVNNVIVPEAYKVSMTYQSLTLEHAGFGKDETQL